MGKQWKRWETLFSWAPKSVQIVTAAMKWKKKAMTNLDSILKSRDIVADKGPSSQSYGFSSSHVWMWELDYKESVKELLLLNYGVGEDSWESLGLQGGQTSQSWRKSVLNIHWKDWCWSWYSNTLATWCEELTHWKRPWFWERLKGGEGDNRGWDCLMELPIWWTWVWASFSNCWWTGKPAML